MIITAIVFMGLLSLFFGICLSFAVKYFTVPKCPIVEQVNELLPQTQCGQCGYPGCRPYAEAIINGAKINKCPPGGDIVIAKLAKLTGRNVKPLSSAHSLESLIKKVAIIYEPDCIGCTKCIQACPVDAILGAPKQMHTVIRSECTGCDLCVAPCPTGCIHMCSIE